MVLVAVSATSRDVAKARMEGAAAGIGREAFVAAIENAQLGLVIDFLESLTGSKDLSLFKPILERAPHYIRSYQILRQSEAAGATRVEIEAYVFEEVLRRDAALLILAQLRQRPKVLLLVAEQARPEEPPRLAQDGPAQTALAESLKGKDLDLVGFEAIRRLHPQGDLLALVRSGTEDGARLGQQHLADVVVLGETVCEVSPSAPGSNLNRVQVNLTLRLVRVQNAAVIETVEGEAVLHSEDVAEGINQAALDAAAKVQDPLFVAVVLATLGMQPSGDVVIEIENLAKPDRLKEVVEAVRGFLGVEGVEELLATEQLCRVRVRYSGPMPPFVEHLTSKTYSDFRLATQRVVDRDVLFTVHSAH